MGRPWQIRRCREGRRMPSPLRTRRPALALCGRWTSSLQRMHGSRSVRKLPPLSRITRSWPSAGMARTRPPRPLRHSWSWSAPRSRRRGRTRRKRRPARCRRRQGSNCSWPEFWSAPRVWVRWWQSHRSSSASFAIGRKQPWPRWHLSLWRRRQHRAAARHDTPRGGDGTRNVESDGDDFSTTALRLHSSYSPGLRLSHFCSLPHRCPSNRIPLARGPSASRSYKCSELVGRRRGGARRARHVEQAMLVGASGACKSVWPGAAFW
mmetsp:Transcript_91334/g.178876  ORF Transcript_91334/g.178876 Transcript_91334/m.178876 type:complete len:265 (+) Transcript_91334:782-1576(+)